MSFKDYKSSRKEMFQNLKEKVEKEKKENSFSTPADPDDWFPKTDKSGKGMAIIRLFPALENEKVSMVHWIEHFFKYEPTGKYYVEKSLKSFGEVQDDPVAEYNKKLWDSTKDDEHPNRKQAKNQSRKFNARLNVFVLSDGADPESNNKFKKYRFGKKLYEFIMDSMFPTQIKGALIQKEPIDPFDLLEGVNLEISISGKKVGDKIERIYNFAWVQPGPLTKDEKLLTKLYDEFQSEPERWSLLSYTDKSKFKTYEELDKKLKDVLGFDFRTGNLNSSSTNESIPETKAPTHQSKNESQVDKEFIDSVTSTDDEDTIPF